MNIILDGINARAENREFTAVQKKLPSEPVPAQSTRAIAEKQGSERVRWTDYREV